jgi:hypothetical protein
MACDAMTFKLRVSLYTIIAGNALLPLQLSVPSVNAMVKEEMKRQGVSSNVTLPRGR